MSPTLLSWTFLPQRLSIAGKEASDTSPEDLGASLTVGSGHARLKRILAMWVTLLLSGPCMFLAAICNTLNFANKNARPPYLQTTLKAHARVGTRGDINHQ